MATRNRTRQEMREIIDRGESVFFRQKDGGLRVISSHAAIPSEAEMAKNSDEPGAADEAEKSIDEQIAALQRAKASLKLPAATPPEAKADPATKQVKPEAPTRQDNKPEVK